LLIEVASVLVHSLIIVAIPVRFHEPARRVGTPEKQVADFMSRGVGEHHDPWNACRGSLILHGSKENGGIGPALRTDKRLP
jgi:hypothetical protein